MIERNKKKRGTDAEKGQTCARHYYCNIKSRFARSSLARQFCSAEKTANFTPLTLSLFYYFLSLFFLLVDFLHFRDVFNSKRKTC